ncbi:hypothetical protein CLV67_110191 [Actinoplanes italicus]|uniref:Uncharacterized protein n=1 Tax=Actinoplanes italicus TaxID=113567 RepID=A0A2T0K8N1_9ACTN|nr:hypothetical protein CLV67_110191 [Actinoplanes italicus]
MRNVIKDWRQRRAARRVTSGDGRPLKPFRWWQLLTRALFHLPLSPGYAVDLPYRANSGSGKARAHLYVGGRHHAVSKLPAAFPVEGGTIEVAISAFGVKRCHYVTTAGAECQLIPDPRSAEGRRARVDRDRPGLSRSIGYLSVLMLLIGVGLNLLQLAEPISGIPAIADSVGRFTSPVHLPIWLNLALAVGAALGSTERSLRLRYSLLDQAGK